MRKNTYMTGPAQPRQPREAKAEAALWLATVARRFANDRAGAKEVEQAFADWKSTLTQHSQAMV